MEKAKKPFYKKVGFYVVAVTVLFVLIVGIVYLSSYGIQQLIIQIVCDDKSPSTPDNYAQILEQTNKVSDIKYDSKYADGYLDIISPKDNNKMLPLVMYIHGGYYVGGDKLTKEAYCRVIADKGYIVANINYVLSPQGQYPAQLLQANTAMAYLMANASTYNIDTSKVFIGGDSAGGHLSGQLGAYYTNKTFSDNFEGKTAIEAKQLKGVLLLCGFYNYFTVRATNFPLLNEAMWMFSGEREYEKAPMANLINTIDNISASFPSTYMTCGDKDPFYSQNQEMATKLKSFGVTVVDFLPKTTSKDLKHEFQSDFSLHECKVGLEKLFVFMSEAIK